MINLKINGKYFFKFWNFQQWNKFFFLTTKNSNHFIMKFKPNIVSESLLEILVYIVR